MSCVSNLIGNIVLSSNSPLSPFIIIVGQEWLLDCLHRSKQTSPIMDAANILVHVSRCLYNRLEEFLAISIPKTEVDMRQSFKLSIVLNY